MLIIVPLAVLIVKSDNGAAGWLSLPGFGSWTAFLLQVLPDGLFRGEPVPANFSACDYIVPQQAPDVAGGETTDLGSLRDGDEH